jgi:hypothetical protein
MLLEHENMKAVSITSASVFIFFEFIILFFLKIKDPSDSPREGRVLRPLLTPRRKIEKLKD